MILITKLHENIVQPGQVKENFYDFLSIALSLMIGIAQISKSELIEFFLNTINPMIKLAGDILQDINGLVIKNRHSLARSNANELSDEELIKSWGIFLLEGIDFSQEEIFETLHPYPLGDSHQKDQFYFPGALGINFELDPRSRVENNSDNLQLDSSVNHDNTNVQIDNNFKTSYSIVSKASDKHSPPIRFTLGPKVNVDFYGRNPVNQVRNNMN